MKIFIVVKGEQSAGYGNQAIFKDKDSAHAEIQEKIAGHWDPVIDCGNDYWECTWCTDYWQIEEWEI